MTFPPDICKLIIKNMDIVEIIPEAREATERQVFSAINARIEKAVGERGDWKGCFDLVTEDDDGETSFAPDDWPESDDDCYMACYSLTCSPGESDDRSWLSCATGANGASLCFELFLDPDLGGLSALKLKRRLEAFFADNPEPGAAGFVLVPNTGRIIRPFSLDPEELALAFPDPGDSLSRLDRALEDVFGAHGAFDALVRRLARMGGDQ
ncbi:MAG: hypothetical protein LBL95_01675 [Deltaproteobacteria bacterium]|jgi:hypothetical protein|nr:hypothetical protein [Deltaproteobacteria bacterium]